MDDYIIKIEENLFKNIKNINKPNILELVFQKGRSHNCMIVKHWDVIKHIHSPDDPHSKSGTVQYRKFLRETGVNFPKMALGSYHSYFSFRIAIQIDAKNIQNNDNYLAATLKK